MIDGKILVEKLLKYARSHLHLNARDEIYMRNFLLREFNLGSPCTSELDLSYIDELSVPDTIVEELESFAINSNLTDEAHKNLYSTFIMGVLSPLPSTVNQTFKDIKANKGIIKACEYLYCLSVKNNYVQKTAIGRNLKWEYPDGENRLEITVNLSKPEKDNKDIAKLLVKTPSASEKYPECLLCKENEGFSGTLTHPARENIRTISVNLGGEDWFVQYSPYAYYNEHMIAISNNHVPMHIASDTIEKLLDFVDYFPNYMVGSNAALPIIGGSILNHEHFQGGGYLMPMHKANVKKKLTCKKYLGVKVGVVDWYNSVIRLEGDDRKEIKDFATEIVSVWENYSDANVGVFSSTDGVKHNSLSPICRKEGDGYILDIIFRNNRCDEKYPDGIFHAHPEYHNIKKEGIGLIEAMGLFILPGRLKKELDEIEDILCGKASDEISEGNALYKHRHMIEELVSGGLARSKSEAKERVQKKVGEICKNILLNTAVFKRDEQGEKAFVKFLNACGIK